MAGEEGKTQEQLDAEAAEVAAAAERAKEVEKEGAGEGKEDLKAIQAKLKEAMETIEAQGKTMANLQSSLTNPEYLQWLASQERGEEPEVPAKTAVEELSDAELDAMTPSQLAKYNGEQMARLLDEKLGKFEQSIEAERAAVSTAEAARQIKELKGTKENPGPHPDFDEYHKEMWDIVKRMPTINPKEAIVLAKEMREAEMGTGKKAKTEKEIIEDIKKSVLAATERPGVGLSKKPPREYKAEEKEQAASDAWDATVGKV